MTRKESWASDGQHAGNPAWYRVAGYRRFGPPPFGRGIASDCKKCANNNRYQGKLKAGKQKTAG